MNCFTMVTKKISVFPGIFLFFVISMAVVVNAAENRVADGSDSAEIFMDFISGPVERVGGGAITVEGDEFFFYEDVRVIDMGENVISRNRIETGDEVRLEFSGDIAYVVELQEKAEDIRKGEGKTTRLPVRKYQKIIFEDGVYRN